MSIDNGGMTVAEQVEWYKGKYPLPEPEHTELQKIRAAELKMAFALKEEWIPELPPVRCYRALYNHPKHGPAVAQLLQRQGVNGFEIGVVACDYRDQLKAYTLGTAEAVVWLGIWQSTIPYEWKITL